MALKRYRLRVAPPEGEPFDHVLSGESLLIGRSLSADLKPADPSLSRQHARIDRRGEGFVLCDLGSRNGTFLNDRLIAAPEPLLPGDVVRLSATTIIVAEADALPVPLLEQGTRFFRASDLLPAMAASLSPAEIREESARHYVERLEILNEVHEALGRLTATEDFLKLILDRAFDHLRPEQGVIYLRGADGMQQRVAERTLAGSTSPPLDSRSLLSAVVGEGMAALVKDVATDARLGSTQSLFGLRSLAAAPLLDGDGAMGMIAVTSKAASQQFNEDDLKLLVSLAAVAALKIKNSSLTEAAARQRRELELARRIQQALLPAEIPQIAGYEILGDNLPSQGISGDYFQVVPRRGGRELALVVADVSGKGIAASLLTASLEALSAALLEDIPEPGELASRLSGLLLRRTPPEKYATAIFAFLEAETGVLRYANAGHPPGFQVKLSGEVEELGATGPPVGLLAQAAHATRQVALGPGDTVLFYTDGWNEAVDPAGDEFSCERLGEICRLGRHRPLDELARALDDELASFARGVPFADDRTLILLRRRLATPGTVAAVAPPTEGDDRA